MGGSFDERLASFRKQIDESRIAGQIGTKDQRIHQRPDQPFSLYSVTVGHRSSNTNDFLTGVSRDQRLKSCQHRQKRRDSVAAVQLPERAYKSARQLDGLLMPLEVLLRRPRPVGRQLKSRGRV